MLQAHTQASTTMNSSLIRWRRCSSVTRPIRCHRDHDMFGDILSDEAAELSGSLGLAGRSTSAIATGMAQAQRGYGAGHPGQDKANPISLILSAAMLIDWLGRRHRQENLTAAARLIEQSVDAVLQQALPGGRSISVVRSAPMRLHRSCARRSMHMPATDTATFIPREDAATIEHRAFMKAAWRLVPFVTIGYLLNYMDRNNVGFAALTMNRDDGTDGDRVRVRRRSAVLRLQRLRDPQQHRALPVWRATLDCPNHDHLGARVGRHRIRQRPAKLVHPAPAARNC